LPSRAERQPSKKHFGRMEKVLNGLSEIVSTIFHRRTLAMRLRRRRPSQWAENLRDALPAARCSSASFSCRRIVFAYAKQTRKCLRVHARIPLLAGCSSHVAGLRQTRIEGGVRELVLALLPRCRRELKVFVHTQQTG